MKTNKRLLVSTFAFLAFLGIGSATVYVKTTAAAYCGVCSSLEGVPGVLQRAGFIPEGSCKKRENQVSTDKEDRDNCEPQACEVNGKKGHCVAKVFQKRHYCACEPRKISR
jgi:hypothetical protein